MEKENKKISNQQIISIVCLAVIIICVINAFFLEYTGFVHVKFDSIDDYVITFGLSIIIVACLSCILNTKSGKDHSECSKSSKKNLEYSDDIVGPIDSTNNLGYSGDYSFVKSRIDKLHFDTPSQMADYFCENFKDYPSFECTLRMAVFAYNYFNIEKLNKKSHRFWYEVALFNNAFKNPKILKKYIDVPATLNVEEYISSYDDMKFVVYNLFEDSELKNKYQDIFDKKHMLNKYKL